MPVRKYLAPILIFVLFTALIVGYFISTAFGLIQFGLHWVLIILVPILIWLVWTFVNMVRERIKEIKEEDKNDLSKY